MSEVCPIDGCNSRHDTRNGVVQHIFMKKSGAHGRITDKGEAWELVISSADNDNDSGRSDNDNESGNFGSENSESTSDNDNEQNRELSFPSSDGDNDNERLDENQETGCPDCGCPDWYDSADILRNHSDILSGVEMQALRRSEHVCTDCGEVY